VQQGVAGIPEIMTSFYWQGYWDNNTGLYRPLSLVMFALENSISGGKPFVYHLLNVLLYGCSIVLLVRVLKKLNGGLSDLAVLLIAMLFAAFPLHTEVVANIKSRDEIMALLLGLLSMNTLLKQDRPGMFQHLAAALFMLLALLSKEAAILFPLWLISIWLLNRKEPAAVVFKKILPIALVTLCWLGWRYMVIHRSSPPLLEFTYQDNSVLACGGPAEQFCTGIALFGKYLMHSIWPFHFSYDYSFQQIPCSGFGSIRFIVSLAALLGLIWLTILAFRKGYGLAGTGILIFLIGTLFISNIFFLTGTTYAERLLYSPSLGLMLALVSFIDQKWQLKAWNSRASLILFTLVLMYSSFVFIRNADWKSNSLLFKADLLSAPNSARVQYNYATALMLESNGKQPKMIQAFKRATSLDPRYYDAWFNLGRAYYLAKDYGASVDAFKKARVLKDDDPALLHNLADACMMNKEYAMSVQLLRECIQLNYTRRNTYDFLGSALFSLQRIPEAREAFETGLKADSTQAGMWLNYGNTLAAGGNVPAAIPAFKKAYQLAPDNKQVLYFLSMAYGQTGDAEKSAYYLQWFNTGKNPEQQ
jgi:protein O-mannosyl-transferase